MHERPLRIRRAHLIRWCDAPRLSSSVGMLTRLVIRESRSNMPTRAARKDFEGSWLHFLGKLWQRAVALLIRTHSWRQMGQA